MGEIRRERVSLIHTHVTSKAMKNSMAYLVYAQVAELVSVDVDLRCESTTSGLALPEGSI
jgi:hypothetical protein